MYGTISDTLKKTHLGLNFDILTWISITKLWSASEMHYLPEVNKIEFIYSQVVSRIGLPEAQ